MSKIKTKNILISGYPKSGTTWLTKLTADILNCPSAGFWNYEDDVLVTEGTDRISAYRCYKTHQLYKDLMESEEPISKIIYVMRDPRDVVVSGAHHFVFLPQLLRKMLRNLISSSHLRHKVFYSLNQYVNIAKKKNEMLNAVLGQNPNPPKWLEHSWATHIESFHNNKDVLVLKYEDLLDNTLNECKKISNYLQHSIEEENLKKIIHQQSFEVKKKQYAKENDYFNKRHLRKGQTQEWKTALNDEQLQLITASSEELMHQYKYL